MCIVEDISYMYYAPKRIDTFKLSTHLESPLQVDTSRESFCKKVRSVSRPSGGRAGVTELMEQTAAAAGPVSVVNRISTQACRLYDICNTAKAKDNFGECFLQPHYYLAVAGLGGFA